MSTCPTRRAALLAAAALPAFPAFALAAPVAAPCPVEAMGRDLAALIEAHDAADTAAVRAAPPDKPAAWARFEAIEQRLHAMLDELPRLRAASLEGVLVQAMHASCLVSVHDGGLPAEVEADVQRLLTSVVCALEAVSGVRREALGGDFMMTRRLDPVRGITT